MTIENITVEFHDFPNKGYILTQAPDILMREITDSINNMISGQLHPLEYNGRLAGHLKKEFQLNFSPEAQRVIERLGQSYHDRHGSPAGIKNKYIEAWVNMQAKHEFNPIHDHEGILSWVIWVQIPYDLQQELQVFPKANCHKASVFGFVYTDTLGNISTIELPVDQTWQGRMCIFPAAMKHFVNPFYTSDGIRISVAGNLG
jgi:hypothetical protein